MGWPPKGSHQQRLSQIPGDALASPVGWRVVFCDRKEKMVTWPSALSGYLLPILFSILRQCNLEHVVQCHLSTCLHRLFFKKKFMK